MRISLLVFIGLIFFVSPAWSDPLGKGLSCDVSPERKAQSEDKSLSRDAKDDLKADRRAKRPHVDQTERKAAHERMRNETARLVPAMSAYQQCVQEKKATCAEELKASVASGVEVGAAQ